MWVRDDQARAVDLLLCGLVGGSELVEVVDVVDVLDVPPVGLEPLALVLRRERERRRAVDRDAVVVVEIGQLAEAEMAGDRRGLACHSFHQVAVGADRVDPVVDDLLVRSVVALREEALGDPEPDTVPDPLSQRPRRGLDAGRVTVLGVPWGARAPLPELLQVVERQVVAGQVQRGVLEDAGVAGREHEPVPIRPRRVGRVVPHELRVEEVRDRREGHCRSRMAGVRLLHRVHREHPDRVDRAPLQVIRGHSRTIRADRRVSDGCLLPTVHPGQGRFGPPP
jgi:hypothetical protein